MAGLSPLYNPYPGTEEEDQRYGLGVAQLDGGASDNYGLELPPVEAPVEEEAPAPKASDTQRGLVDYMKNWAQTNIQEGNDAYEQNRVDPAQIEASRGENKTRQLIAGLADSAAKIGNVRGQSVKSTLPDFVNQMQQGDKDYFDQKRKVSESGLARAEAGRKSLNDVGSFEKRIAEMDNAAAKSDPNSEISRAMREAIKTAGMAVPDNVSAAAIEKTGLGQQARQIALEKMRQEHSMKVEGVRSRDRRAGDESRRELADLKTQGVAEKDRKKDELELRKRFDNNPVVKEFNDLDSRAKQLEQLNSSDIGRSGAANQAIVYIFNKLLDPGSVVRETEYANAASNSGKLNEFKMLAEKLSKGEFLSESQKRDMANTAKEIVSSARVKYDNIVDDLAKDAEYYGLNTERVLGSSAYANKIGRTNASQPAQQSSASIPVWTPNSRTAGN